MLQAQNQFTANRPRIRSIDFNLLQVPKGPSVLPTTEQTPNRFLNSIGQGFELEVNHFNVALEAETNSPPLKSLPHMEQHGAPEIQLGIQSQMPHLSLTQSHMPMAIQNQNQETTPTSIPNYEDWQARRSSVASVGYTENHSFGLNLNKRRKSDATDIQSRDRTNFLERNRKAAMKCRQKKKEYLQGLETKVETLSRENADLRSEIEKLKEELEACKS